jgi:hypothetical protein
LKALPTLVIMVGRSILLVVVLSPAMALAQQPGWQFDLGATYGWYPTFTEQPEDNLLDRHRNDAIALSLSCAYYDTLTVFDFSYGGGAGAVLWESTPMLALTIHGTIYPNKSRYLPFRWPYIRGEFGWLIGAWLPTDDGQLHGSALFSSAVGFPVRKNMFFEFGLMNLTAKGPYALDYYGDMAPQDQASFFYMTGGVRVRF